MAAATAVALAGCYTSFPDPNIGPRQIVVLAFDPDSQKVSLVPETVSTLHYLRTMQGDAAKVFAQATVTADFAAIAEANPATPDDLQKLVVTNGGKPVDFAYMTVSGALYPEDNDSLNIATSYYNTETAFLFFQDHKLSGLQPTPIYYFANYSAKPATIVSVTDLGVTDPPLGVLVVPPFKDETGLPPSMQAGIVAYQYSANVFQQQVFGADVALSFLLQKYTHPDTKKGETADTWARALNLTRGLQAGYADYFAAAIVNDPTYVHTPGGQVDESRRLDPPQARCFSGTATPLTAPREEFDPHSFGSVLAASLWVVDSNRNGTAKETFRQGIVDSMKSVSSAIKSKNSTLKIEDVVSAVAASVGTNDRPRLCGLLLGRFNLAPSDVTACAESVPEVTCAGQ